jgi:hypothetical protein
MFVTGGGGDGEAVCRASDLGDFGVVPEVRVECGGVVAQVGDDLVAVRVVVGVAGEPDAG